MRRALAVLLTIVAAFGFLIAIASVVKAATEDDVPWVGVAVGTGVLIALSAGAGVGAWRLFRSANRATKPVRHMWAVGGAGFISFCGFVVFVVEIAGATALVREGVRVPGRVIAIDPAAEIMPSSEFEPTIGFTCAEGRSCEFDQPNPFADRYDLDESVAVVYHPQRCRPGACAERWDARIDGFTTLWFHVVFPGAMALGCLGAAIVLWVLLRRGIGQNTA